MVIPSTPLRAWGSKIPMAGWPSRGGKGLVDEINEPWVLSLRFELELALELLNLN